MKSNVAEVFEVGGRPRGTGVGIDEALAVAAGDPTRCRLDTPEHEVVDELLGGAGKGGRRHVGPVADGAGQQCLELARTARARHCGPVGTGERRSAEHEVRNGGRDLTERRESRWPVRQQTRRVSRHRDHRADLVGDRSHEDAVEHEGASVVLLEEGPH
ncbi:MAG: hypothetical protein AAF211_28255 [Myxococcota bacterium]